MHVGFIHILGFFNSVRLFFPRQCPMNLAAAVLMFCGFLGVSERSSELSMYYFYMKDGELDF